MSYTPDNGHSHTDYTNSHSSPNSSFGINEVNELCDMHSVRLHETEMNFSAEKFVLHTRPGQVPRLPNRDRPLRFNHMNNLRNCTVEGGVFNTLATHVLISQDLPAQTFPPPHHMGTQYYHQDRADLRSPPLYRDEGYDGAPFRATSSIGHHSPLLITPPALPSSQAFVMEKKQQLFNRRVQQPMQLDHCGYSVTLPKVEEVDLKEGGSYSEVKRPVKGNSKHNYSSKQRNNKE